MVPLIVDTAKQYADLFPGEYRREVDYLAHFHFVEDGPNRLDVQVTMIEGTNSNLRLIDRRAVVFFNRADVKKVFAHLVLAQRRWIHFEVISKQPDGRKIMAYGVFRQITKLDMLLVCV